MEAAYAHQGRFEYEARVPRSPVYPDGQVSTGEPVFQRLVPRLRVTFSYRLESELPVTARGRIALDARISDGRGWERILPLAAERPFDQGGTTVSGVLDLEYLQRLTDQVRDLTGSGQTAYTVAVLPASRRPAASAARRSTASSPRALLRRRRPAPAAEPAGRGGRRPVCAARARQRDPRRPAEISLGPFSLSVANARRLSLSGSRCCSCSAASP